MWTHCSQVPKPVYSRIFGSYMIWCDPRIYRLSLVAAVGSVYDVTGSVYDVAGSVYDVTRRVR